MKLALTVTIAFLLHFSAIAADTTIVFRQIRYSEVFKIAKKEKKAVLLYFHFDGCGACVTMEKKTFTNNKVATFYNSNFICFEVNTLKGEGIETNKIYKVQLHPTFLFLDENGNTLNKIVGVFNPDEFVLQAKNALNPIKTLVYLKQQYNNGTRNADFLLEYCYRLRDANELDSLIINEYLNTQKVNQLNKEENIKFIYEFALHNGKTCISAESNAYKFMHDNKDLFKPYFDIEQVESRLMFVILPNVYQAIEKRDTVGFRKAIEVLKEYDTGKEYNFKEMDGRITRWTTSKSLVLTAELAYYQQIGDLAMYNTTLNSFLETIWNDSEALNSYAWDCYEKENDNTKLEKAVDCVIKSIELNNNYNNNDTYAALLYKLKEYDKALTQAEIAIEIAKKNNIEYKGTTDLIIKIKNNRKK